MKSIEETNVSVTEPACLRDLDVSKRTRVKHRLLEL